ncbi:sulfite exporter TauE/SafE family protein [Aliiroseovarius subalbicans]|uniref:sulfite exporter TauE/SafE family protein n=1 Tax=Aliiroseovarius subalbicans TaxID=2925840 RepID=UPI001F59732F|nr:sulfite exporter TauE/SafE family protein [Aliiroseovarius subalbicans]MCI2399715.1 sulfite exporter TauE/SafE family protein [Aliiroseovarius subalbicans]
MSGILADLPILTLLIAAAITLFAGFVKGAVGFAMPMIMISGLGSVLPADIALAALILPTVVTNVFQALRQGVGAAWKAVGQFRIYLIALLVFLIASAQLVRVLSPSTLYLLLGLPVVGFSLLQLVGWVPRLRSENRRRDEGLVGSFAGFVGGMSGVWGPPTVLFLTAIDTPKADQMRVQGVIYGLGAVALLGAHVQSGVFTSHTAPLSAVMLVPALAGMVVGGWVHDRMPQVAFRRVTLVVLIVAGLNLVRRGLIG